MTEPQPLDVLRAVLDPVRLAVAGAAAVGPVRIGELAAELEVPPKTVARAAGDLRGLGVLTADGELDVDVLRSVAVSLPSSGGRSGGRVSGPFTDEEAEVLGRFFDGDRLEEIPSSRSKRLLVLEKVALAFEPGRRYPERDVNFMIQLVHPDYVTLRRYLVDEAILDRADGAYWRIGGRVDVPVESELPVDPRSPLLTEIDGVELRAYERSMVPALVAAANDERIPRYMSDQFATPYTDEDAETWMDVATAATPPTQYAVFRDGELVGGIGGFPGSAENTGSIEIGWWLHPDHWGHGIMSACARVIVDEFIGVRGAMRLWAPVMHPNVASAKVAEGAGLRFEGTSRWAYLKGGVRYDQRNYGITRADWLAAR